MKLNRHIKSALLALVGLALCHSNLTAQPATSYTNSFDNAAGVTSWLYWYGLYQPGPMNNYFNNNPMAWNSTIDDTPSVPGSGSLEVSIPWNVGSPNDQVVTLGTFGNQYGYDGTVSLDGTKYTNIVLDVYVDPTSPVNQNNNYGTLNIGFAKDVGGNWSVMDWNASSVALPLSAGGAWYHIVVPIDITTAGINSVQGITLTMNTYSGGSLQASNNPTHFYVDNLQVIAATVPVAPPTLVAPYKPVQGLNVFSSLADGNLNERTSIKTVGTSGLGWYNAANPVTYSTTIAAFPNGGTYAGYQSHIFITTGSPPSYETSPDYNETNLIVLEIHENTDGVSAYASFRYKINEPNSNGNEFGTDNGTAGTLATFNAPTVIGTWSITFNNNTDVTLNGPGGSSTNFSISSAAAAAFNAPLNVFLGAQPNSTAGYGQDVVYSSFSIAGNASPLSDNFLADTSLNTGTWAIYAGDTATVQLVPAGSAYWLAWSLPDGGFTLQASSSVNKGSPWTSLSGLSSFTTAGQRREILPAANLPSASKGFFRLTKFTFTQLQVLLPGETAAPGTLTGKTGMPNAANTTGLYTFTVNAVDANWNPVAGISDTITISSSDGAAFTPLNAPLVNGTATFQIQFQTGGGGTQTITATDFTDGTKTANTSSPVVVN